MRVVLHRGAAAKDTSDFTFADPARLARWPAKDRGILTFADVAAVEAKRAAVADIVARWIAA